MARYYTIKTDLLVKNTIHLVAPGSKITVTLGNKLTRPAENVD